MAPSRFQCLKVATHMVKRGFNAKVGFSTSQTRRADQPRNASSAADLLSSISTYSTAANTSSPSPSQTEPSSPSGPTSLNPISMPTANNSAMDIVKLYRDAKAKKDLAAQIAGEGTMKSLSDHFQAQDYSKHITRRWRAGDVYAPHDLSGVEMRKWKQRQKPTHDIFDVLAFNPEEHYRNFNIMSEFMTPMGRIKHSKETGLRPVNQRRIARAIRRSIGIGMMPSVHRHPEILYRERERSERVPERYKRTSGAPAPL